MTDMDNKDIFVFRVFGESYYVSGFFNTSKDHQEKLYFEAYYDIGAPFPEVIVCSGECFGAEQFIPTKGINRAFEVKSSVGGQLLKNAKYFMNMNTIRSLAVDFIKNFEEKSSVKASCNTKDHLYSQKAVTVI